MDDTPGQNNDKSCGASIEEHTSQVMVGLQMMGLGFGCPEAYAAVAEVAEVFRRAGGHEVHVPVEGGPADKLAIAIAAHSEASLGEVLGLLPEGLPAAFDPTKKQIVH